MDEYQVGDIVNIPLDHDGLRYVIDRFDDKIVHLKCLTHGDNRVCYIGRLKLLERPENNAKA